MSLTLDRLRAKYPEYSRVSDDELTVQLGTKHPEYLEADAEFKEQFQTLYGRAITQPPQVLPSQIVPGSPYLPPLSPQGTLRAEMEEVRSQDQAARWLAKQNTTPKDMGQAALQEVQKGAGGLLSGLAALTERLPLHEPGEPITPELAEEERRRMTRTPAQLMHDLQRNPLNIAGQALMQTAEASHPVSPRSQEALATQAAQGLGGFVLPVASGPLAPLTIGLQGAGERISSEYDAQLQSGKTPEQAADIAIKKAEASGLTQATIFAILPTPLRKLGDKFLIDKFAPELGKNLVTRFLAARAAQAGEGAVLGAVSQAGENIVQGQPVTEGTLASALGLGALQAITPRGATAREADQAQARAVAQAEQPAARAPAAEPQPAATPSQSTMTEERRAIEWDKLQRRLSIEQRQVLQDLPIEVQSVLSGRAPQIVRLTFEQEVEAARRATETAPPVPQTPTPTPTVLGPAAPAPAQQQEQAPPEAGPAGTTKPAPAGTLATPIGIVADPDVELPLRHAAQGAGLVDQAGRQVQQITDASGAQRWTLVRQEPPTPATAPEPSPATATPPQSAEPGQPRQASPEAAKRRLISEQVNAGIDQNNLQVTINPLAGAPGGGYVQVDLLHAQRGSLFSTNPEQMRELGFEMPGTAELLQLPAGRYTLSQISDLLAQQPSVDTPTPEPEIETDEQTAQEPRQPRTGPSGVDVREPAGPGRATPSGGQASGAPRPEEPAGVEAGGTVEGEPGPERGRSLRDREPVGPGASGRASDERRPAGPGALVGAGENLAQSGDAALDQNHVLPAAQDWIPTGDKSKVRANLDAVRLLRRLETEQRNPTPEEKAVLARYTGWGGLKEIFDEGKAAYRQRGRFFSSEQESEFRNWDRNWGQLYDEVKATLTPNEYRDAAQSILNAHYTSREVINAVWQGVKRLGFRGGNALEPAGGIGHFIGLQPADTRAGTRWRAVELDNVSGHILAKLYPQAAVHQVGFEEARIPANSQDLVISNVPFAKDGPRDSRYPRLSLHNFFFARGLDLLKPGGIMAAITSDSTMDSASSRQAREYLAGKADLAGAIRLPNNAFAKNAGTEVTTDILFFRKRDATPFQGEPFTRTEPIRTYKGEPVEVNEYFARHPDMMLGRMSREGTMYQSGQPALLPIPGAKLENQLAGAVAKLPQNVAGTAGTPAPAAAAPQAIAESGAKIGQLVVKNGQVHQVQADGTMQRPEWAHKGRASEQAKRYIEVREATRAVITRQLDPNTTDAELADERAKLNRAYDTYVKRHGAINGRASSFLNDDVDFPLALALEDANTRIEETTTDGKKSARRVTEWTKSKLFTERTIFPRVAPERVDTVADGLQVSLNFQGRVDPEYIARLSGKTIEEVKSTLALTGQAFENPETGQWESRAQYLSGFVKKKLEAARVAAADNPLYAPNVAELAKVQPAPIAIENIGVRLGSTWVPPEVIDQFLMDRLHVSSDVSFTEQTGQWHVTPTAGQAGERNTTTYGIHGWKGHELVEKALNLQSPIVTREERYTTEEGKSATREVKDAPKTLEAQEKQGQLQRLFVDWAKAGTDTARKLEQIYNEKFNGVVAPKFEPPTWSHYPGASQDITLRDHQKAVVTRMLENSTLLAHAVGTGKTWAMASAAMEMRRLGLARKPMIVVQNATLEQFTRSFKRLYPAARILVPNAKARDSVNRNKTMSRIATGDWDAVIIPQSFVNMLPDDPLRERAYINDRLTELRQALIEARAEAGKKSPKASDLQRAIKRLEERLDSLKDRKKDNVLTFEQLGVDALFVDEAHAYKKLEFGTKMDNIKGLDTGASQRGLSMFFKVRWVQEHNQGRNVVFATGTPVSNTIAEAWNMMRYVRPDVLKAYGIEDFDSFAATFGDTLTQLEMTAGGNWKPVTRFARYINGPELIAAWRTVADVVTAEEINLPGLPSLKNGKTTAVTVAQTPRLKNYVAYLRSELERFDKMSGQEKRQNSHIPLVVFGLAKKATLDMRMIDPNLPDEPTSKLNAAADHIARVYKESTPAKGAQMVFSDAYQDDPDKPRFNLYAALKSKLVARGIPEGQIAILTPEIKDARREALFTKVNDGDIRVVIGSTERMGIGVNAQEHLIGLHHLDAPPRPMDIEQREGRILRQGNQNPEVEIFSYGVENTLDAAMFQKLATKQRFINQLLRGDLAGRDFEDAANEQSLSFDEQMAAFSGDPRAMQRVALDNQIRQLESLRSGHFNQVREARETITRLQERAIPYQQKQVEEAQGKAAALSAAFAPEKELHLESSGGTKDGRKAVAEELDTVFGKLIDEAKSAARGRQSFDRNEPPRSAITTAKLNGVGFTFQGVVPLDQTGKALLDDAHVRWGFAGSQPESLARTGPGFLSSLNAALERARQEPERAARSLANEERNLRELTGFVHQPFGRDGELEQARARLAQLNNELRAEGQAEQPPGPQPSEGGRAAAMGTSAPRPVRAPQQQANGTNAAAAALQRAGSQAAPPGRKWFLGLRGIFAPQTINDAASQMAGIIRHALGKEYEAYRQADFALAEFRKEFDRTPVPRDWTYTQGSALPRNYEVMRAIDSGDLQNLTPAEQRFVSTMRRLFDEAIDLVQEVSPNSLRELVENYFPRIWRDPERNKTLISRLLSHRPWEGPKSFLKKRTLEYFTEGLELGLRPVSDNPADVTLQKLGEMYRFVATRRAMAEAKAAGLRRFVYIFEPPPDGWHAVDDPSSNVFKPPTVTIKEAFDAQIRAKTLELLDQLGIAHERLAKIGGRRWGYSTEADSKIVTKFGGPAEVFWHEVGHQMDWRYPDLGKLFFPMGGQSDVARELRALADLRFEGDPNATDSFKRYVRRGDEKIANLFHAYIHTPGKFQRTAPNVWRVFNTWLGRHPEVKNPLIEIRPGLRTAEGSTEYFVGGPILLGRWFMPEGAAQVATNYLQPGLGKFKTFRAIRDIASLLNGIQLAGFFHGQFVLNDSFYSGVGLGLYDVLSGKPVRGITELLKPTPGAAAGAAIGGAVGGPPGALIGGVAGYATTGPLESLYRGHKIKAAIENPAAADAHYRQLAQLAIEQNLRAGHSSYDPQFSRRWTRAIHELVHAPSTGAAWETLWRTPLGAVETAMKPVMELLVPRMKLGIYARMAERVIADNPNADQDTLRRLLAKAADATEDRLGQITYDNLFQTRVLKDAGQLAFRAYGWQLTKYRMLFGGAGDWVKAAGALSQGQRPEISFRMAYLPAMVIGHAIIGGTLMYALTGRKPKDLVDYFFPESGLLDAYGNSVRLSLADFMKDAIADWRAFPSIRKMGAEWTRKLGPLWNMAAELYRNRDFYGTQIFSDGQLGDPASEHLLRTIKEGASYFATTAAEPFSVRAGQKFAEAGSKQLGAAAPFFGVTPAPRYATQTPAESKAAEIMRELMPEAPRTKEQSQHSQQIAALVRDLRTGKVNSEGEFEQRARAANVKNQAELTQLRERVLWTPLQYQVHKMPVAKAMEVFDLAGDLERVNLSRFLAEKIQKAYDGGKLDEATASRYVRLVTPYYQRSLTQPSAPAQQQQQAQQPGRYSAFTP